MNWADWAIISIFSLSCFIGLVRGLVREALSLVIWICAALAAKLFSPQLDVFLLDHIDTPSVRAMAAFAVIFVAVLLLGAMLTYLISALVRATGLSGTDRLLGMLFGAARGFIIVMALLLILPAFIPVHEDTWWQEAQLIPHFLSCEVWVRDAYEQVSQFFMSLFGAAEVAEQAI